MMPSDLVIPYHGLRENILIIKHAHKMIVLDKLLLKYCTMLCATRDFWTVTSI